MEALKPTPRRVLVVKPLRRVGKRHRAVKMVRVLDRPPDPGRDHRRGPVRLVRLNHSRVGQRRVPRARATISDGASRRVICMQVSH